MSWFNRKSGIMPVAAGLVVLSLLGGCQVRPLYSEGSAPALSSIGISDAESRVGQVLRNQLVFLFNGGNSEPSAPDYQLGLKVISSTSSSLEKISSSGPKPGNVNVTAVYTLTKGDIVVRSGKRSVAAQIDRSAQQFALIRAIRDAEDRAAREVAEFIMMDVSAAIQK